MKEDNKPKIEDYEDRMAAPIGAIATGKRPLPAHILEEQQKGEEDDDKVEG